MQKNKKRTLAFGLASIGEFQFFEKILKKYLETYYNDNVYIIHYKETNNALKQSIPEIYKRIIHISYKNIENYKTDFDIFLTTEQYILGIENVYSICLFHGQPSKGLTFNKNIINSFDAFFLYGKLHKNTYYDFIKTFSLKHPKTLELFEVGYSKTDELFNNRFDKNEFLSSLKLDISKKTILYAPAFNEYASLREIGIEIIEEIASLTNYNIIAKLAIDCLEPTTNYYATGGIDWFTEIGKLQKKYSNLILYKELNINKALLCSDILITDISSVSFDFLVLDKPVIFINTPKFFSIYLQKYYPEANTKSWENEIYTNGGKEFGISIDNVSEFKNAIFEVENNPNKYPLNKEKINDILLYNKGKGAEKAVDKINELLVKKVKTKRKKAKHKLYYKQRIKNLIKKKLNLLIKPILIKYKLEIIRTSNKQTSGKGFIGAKETIRAAQEANLSICDYRENQENHPLKKGRRNRIIERILSYNIIENNQTFLEIGAGTGMYVEKIIKTITPKTYHIYETANDWKDYLANRFQNNSQINFLIHQASGVDLKQTNSNSCDIVFAHGVFVYLSSVQTFSYLKESVRVLKKGAYLIFDCYLDSSFNTNSIRLWIDYKMYFPVVISEKLLNSFCRENDLTIISKFSEIHGATQVDYLIIRKK